MAYGAPEVDSPQDDSLIVPEIRRERVVVRRRRSRNHRHKHKHVAWTVRASRRRAVRAIVVCTGVLVLMALGLYYGLSKQATAPAESSVSPHMIAPSGHRA